MLNNNSIVLHTSERYSDNDGSYSVAYVLENDKVEMYQYANGYDGLIHDSYAVNATQADKDKAIAYYRATEQHYTKAGQVYTVKGSRKYPKGTHITVLYGDQSGVMVTDGEKQAWISSNCLHEFISGVHPNFLN